MAWADWPDSYWTSALTWLGTVTSNSSPAFGPEPITRRSRAFDPSAATEETEPEDLHECSEVVRPKVEERASTRRIQERGIGMPQLRSGQLQQRQSRERRPDQTLLDKPAGRLETSTQEGIRRAANK